MHLNSGDAAGLVAKVRAALPDTTFLLADGVYNLTSAQSLEVRAPRITIRSASGNRNAVIIHGGYNNRVVP